MFDAQKKVDRAYNDVHRLTDAVKKYYDYDILEWARLDDVAHDLARRLEQDGDPVPCFSKPALAEAVDNAFHLYAMKTATPDGEQLIFQ